MNLPLPVNNPTLFDGVAQWLCRIPHCTILKLEFVQGERGKATMRLPYQDRLVGNSKTGVLHGGVMTALIDTTSALSIFSLLETPEATPTLDLRIDYLRPATPGVDVYCTAECYRLARNIAFTRATAYQEGNPQPVAYSVGTFMRRHPSKGEAA
ncbi:MAG TPA: PaaI family thioesterase [Limnobacter sp.]|uniref:PaaI family thioesterase n=1 Tax=Limnobacter sp. TaxID=2003368 RepID=UPI002ED9D943